PLGVESRRIGEARKAPHAVAREEAPQDEEVRRVTEEAVDEHDGCRVRRRRIEALAGQQPTERQREGERAERRELAPERPPPPHQCVSSWPEQAGQGVMSRAVAGPGTGRVERHRVEEQHPLAPVEVALEILACPAERQLRVLPVLDELAGG